LKISEKKVVFLLPSGKKTNFRQFWPSLEKYWKNPLVPSPGKNPSDAHAALLWLSDLCMTCLTPRRLVMQGYENVSVNITMPSTRMGTVLFSKPWWSQFER